jgi:hypothetical protein
MRWPHKLGIALAVVVFGLLVFGHVQSDARDRATLKRLLDNDMKFLHWAEGIECDVRHTCGK